MHKCCDCGEIFEGDFCPECGSEDFERLCVSCGDTDANGGICDICLNRYATDYELLEKASNECKTEMISAPALIADVLSAEQIKIALFQYIEKNNIDCSAFIKGDRGWFADFLEKEEKGG